MIPKLRNIIGLISNKVDKVTGKDLSTNDFTDTYKTKLDGIATGATKNTVENSLTSTSTSNALSAAQGKALNTSITNLKPVSLYDNSSGTTGTITLSETSANFSYLEIFYNKTSNRIYAPNGKEFVIIAPSWANTKLRFHTTLITISDKTITRNSNYFFDTDGYYQAYTGVFVYKVIGYK